MHTRKHAHTYTGYALRIYQSSPSSPSLGVDENCREIVNLSNSISVSRFTRSTHACSFDWTRWLIAHAAISSRPSERKLRRAHLHVCLGKDYFHANLGYSWVCLRACVRVCMYSYIYALYAVHRRLLSSHSNLSALPRITIGGAILPHAIITTSVSFNIVGQLQTSANALQVCASI